MKSACKIIYPIHMVNGFMSGQRMPETEMGSDIFLGNTYRMLSDISLVYNDKEKGALLDKMTKFAFYKLER